MKRIPIKIEEIRVINEASQNQSLSLYHRISDMCSRADITLYW